MILTLKLAGALILSLVLTLALIPPMKKVALFMGLVDRPNHRSVHTKPVPLIGGMAIAISTLLTLAMSKVFMVHLADHFYVLAGALALLLIGMIDDRSDIHPMYRLAIQFACAYALAASGTRIFSLYGLFGIEEIPLIAQYLFTMVVIVGVVNGFNLMDGVDGLAGGLALLGFISFAVLSLLLQDYGLAAILFVLIGAISGFLRYNLSKSKIFMGDGGSLFLGFLLVASGIKLLGHSGIPGVGMNTEVLLVVIGIFLVPVLDSLRVYAGRIRKGFSPFRADKSHLHHLFLLTGLNHKLTALVVIIASSMLVIISIGFAYYFPMTVALIAAWLVFKLLTSLLKAHQNLKEWKSKITVMETEFRAVDLENE